MGIDKNKAWEEIVDKTRKNVEDQYPEIFHSIQFGAYLAPENYFVSYIFRTDQELESARESGRLMQINEYHMECMKKNNYPSEGIKDCDFASQEDCEKRYGGNWYYYYK